MPNKITYKKVYFLVVWTDNLVAVGRGDDDNASSKLDNEPVQPPSLGHRFTDLQPEPEADRDPGRPSRAPAPVLQSRNDARPRGESPRFP